jgi:uncharacterized protein YjbI with pentapeptide repeats
VLWGFNLNTGEPVLEQELWQTIGDMLGKNELFDAGMPKPNAEFLVQGSCFARDGKSINANQVSASVGTMSKELMVFGDRHWIKGMGVSWGVSDPKPFTEMPIGYSAAFGGKDYAANPLGKGIEEMESDDGPVIPLPNVEYANQIIGSPTDKPNPASFSRIDMMCEQRMSNAGTYDQKYLETRMPGFPDDFNYDYFNDAAKDQQIESYFKGDEQYEIRNMHPDYAVIKGRIPGVYGRVFVNHEIKGKAEFKEIPTNLDTIWMMPTSELGVLIHRGSIEVTEDDAADIKQILIANENTKDTARSLEHYQKELILRTDQEESFKYLLYTVPLIPEGCPCASQVTMENNDFPLEMLAQQNMKNFAEAKQQEASDKTVSQLKEAGVEQDKIDDILKQMSGESAASAELNPEMAQVKAIMEKVLPGVSTDPKNLDMTKINLKAMDELKAYTDKLQKDKSDEAKSKMVAQLAELKILEGESSPQVKQLESILVTLELPPKLPRIDVDGIVEKLQEQNNEVEKQLLVMQSMGLPDDQLAKIKEAMDPEKIERQLRDGLDKAKNGYRMGAHLSGDFRSPHEGQESEIRNALIKAYKSGAKTAGGDYAFVDLSNLDLSGIDLSSAYLEYADLTNTNFTNANLSKAIFSHAIFKNTILNNTDLTDANLGSIKFDQTKFSHTDLTGALLGKSHICNTQFEHCKLAEKMDAFLGTTFENASFIDSDMRKNVFLDSDISGCDFSKSDLTDSTFVNPVMRNCCFNESILTGVNFVKAQGDNSTFIKAKMKNVRFVGESSFPSANFTSAEIDEANLRDCHLEGACFAEANLFKSDFGGSNLKNANFEKARASQAQFIKSNLTFANLQQADLMEGSMHKTVLSGARLNNSNLYSVNFLGCTVGETDFSGAYLENTIFKDWRPSLS